MQDQSKAILLGVILAALAGCSTAGPFVTNISSDGNGGLTIDRCMVHYNGWTGALTNSDCGSSSVRVNNPLSSK